MKTLVTALLLTAVASASALADPNQKKISPQAAAAQASAPYDQTSWNNNRNAVIDNGKVLGQDPDPSVRSDLKRLGDPTMQNGM